MVAKKQADAKVVLDAEAEKIHDGLVHLAVSVEGHLVSFCDQLAEQINAKLWTRLLNAETGKPRYGTARLWVNAVIGKELIMLSRVARDGIIRALDDAEMAQTDIAEVMKVSQPTVSRACGEKPEPKSDDAKRADVVARAKSVLTKGVVDHAANFTPEQVTELRRAISAASKALNAAAKSRADHPAGKGASGNGAAA
jgi:hypothetical protein